jgi:hypothetical protein
MKKEQILGLVRHALTIIGGALMSLTGVIWSIMDKKK